MTTTTIILLAVAVPIIFCNLYNFTRGIIIGTTVRPTEAQALINLNSIHPHFEVGIAIGNMAVWGPRSWQFIQ